MIDGNTSNNIISEKNDKAYLFKCLLLANFLQYLEAGAVPALLLQLSDSFNMGSAKQGLLGGVVYLSLSLGGPFAGYLLRSYEHKTVISCAVAANMFFTLLWALTPIGQWYSTNLFISLRFIMGLCQCVICVFLPLWTNDNAPKERRTSWMSYLQASVPFGVMTGYIIASTLMDLAVHRDTCWGLLCWRWAFLVEIILLTPLYLGLYFIPKEDIQVIVTAGGVSPRSAKQQQQQQQQQQQVHQRDSTAPCSENSGYNRTKQNLAGDGSSSAAFTPFMAPSGSANSSFIHSPSIPSAERRASDIEAQHPHEQRSSPPRKGHLTPEQRGQYSDWRKAAMSASLYDSMATKYAFKKSYDDITRLDQEGVSFPALPGLQRYETDDDLYGHNIERMNNARNSINNKISSGNNHNNHNKKGNSNAKVRPVQNFYRDINTSKSTITNSSKNNCSDNSSNKRKVPQYSRLQTLPHSEHHHALVEGNEEEEEEEDVEKAQVGHALADGRGSVGAGAGEVVGEEAYCVGTSPHAEAIVPPTSTDSQRKARSKSSDGAFESSHVKRERSNPLTLSHSSNHLLGDRPNLGARRISLQEWFMNQLTGLPYSDTTQAQAQAQAQATTITSGSMEWEETTRLLGTPRGDSRMQQTKTARYGSTEIRVGVGLGFEEVSIKSSAGKRSRRSLDNNIGCRSAGGRNNRDADGNRRSSSAASLGTPRQGRLSRKSRIPETIQYESFKDLTRKSTISGPKRSSWGMLSILGYNNRSDSDEDSLSQQFYYSKNRNYNTRRRSRESPFESLSAKEVARDAMEGSELAHSRARRHSLGDLDDSREELESPSPEIQRTRTRTASNPTMVSSLFLAHPTSSTNIEMHSHSSSSGLYSAKTDVEGAQEEMEGANLTDIHEDDESDPSIVDGDDDYYYSEEDDDRSDFSYELDISCYGASDSESEEDWGGLTPPPAAMTGYYNTPPTIRAPQTHSSTSASNSTEVGAGMGRFNVSRETPGSSTSFVAARLAQIAHETQPEETHSIIEDTARWFRHTYRYLRSVVESVLALLTIKPYRYLLGAMSALYFTVTGVQFWGTKYLRVALHAPLPLVNTLFILCAATGPTLGVFFGGWIVDKNGGYKGAHQRVVALELCATFGVLACLFSIPITLLNNIFLVVALLWMVLFFGGSMLPACSGIVVSIIPRAFRPTSSSLALVVFNMFGYFMSLLLSGYLMQYLDSYHSSCDEVCSMTWGFRLILFWSFISVTFLISALFASYQHLKDRDRGRSLRTSAHRRRHFNRNSSRNRDKDAGVSP